MEMTITEEDFDNFFGEEHVSTDQGGIPHRKETRTRRIRRPETFVSQVTEEEIKDDRLPPWRSASGNTNRYLYVWEQENPITS